MPRMTIRGSMFGILALSVLLAMLRLAHELRYWTISNGWNTSVLSSGQPLFLLEDINVAGAPVKAGTQCIIVRDFTDEDSAYPDRNVRIIVDDGPYKGRSGTARREQLRARIWW